MATSSATSSTALAVLADRDHDAEATLARRVRTWLQHNEDIAQLQALLRERREARRLETAYILDFMSRFGIDSLDVTGRECRLSRRVRHVRAPLTQSTIHDRIVGMYPEDPVKAQTVVDTVFDRSRVEKVGLCRSAARRAQAQAPAPARNDHHPRR